MASRYELMDKLVSDCEKIIESCGYTLPFIEYSLNPNLSRAIGRCQSTINRITKHRSNIKIQLSESHFLGYARAKQYDKIRNTILHEMCHALPNGNSHGTQWKHYAYVVGKKSNQDITRLAPDDEIIMSLKTSKAKYVIECSEYGKQYTYTRLPKIANRIGGCRCVVCTNASLKLKTL